MTPSYFPHVPVDQSWDPSTVTVQAGRPKRVPGAAMNPAITLSSTYIHGTDLSYGRDGNESWGALEDAVGTLEGGQTVSFASGLAAATAIADLVPTNGVVLIPRAAYYGVNNVFSRMQEHGRLTVRTVEADDTHSFIAAIPGADMVWVESISNPAMIVADIPAIAKAAHDNGALLVVDATFATPLRQKPLDLGADIVLHSATKLIGGHSDLLLGVATAKRSEHFDFLYMHRHDHGSVPGGIDAFLALRGLRTLSIRMEKAQANAEVLAARLVEHASVTKVYYPGLPDSPQREKALRVLPQGCGNMLSFEIAGTVEDTDRKLSQLKLVSNATSLGGVESALERRSRWAAEIHAGVPMTLCRMSVGIENVEDIWRDLDGALSS